MSFCSLLCAELDKLLNYNETKAAEEVGGHSHRNLGGLNTREGGDEMTGVKW